MDGQGRGNGEVFGMARALTFSYVRQLPRNTLQEVTRQENVYDRQVVLNELWPRYCQRIGRTDRISEEVHRDKWVTETWEEWEGRKRLQPQSIASFFDKLDQQSVADEANVAQRAAQTEKVLAGIEHEEGERQRGLLPVLHTLLLDFDERQAQARASRRQRMEEDEATTRAGIEREEEGQRVAMAGTQAGEADAVAEMLRQRALAEEEAARRRAVEQQQHEEDRRKAEEEAERQRQEDEAQRLVDQKRLEQEERDKKAAERKARVMAERQRRQSKEEEAAARLDTRRRSSGRHMVETLQIRRDASRGARLDRQQAEMDAYLAELKPRAAAANSQELLDGLLKEVAKELGLLLFDCAVYIGAIQGPAVHYIHASDNCSAVLKEGKERLIIADHPSCPTVQAIGNRASAHLSEALVTEGIKDTMVRVGTQEDSDELHGDFFTTPIYNAANEVCAMLSADTFAALNAKQTNLLENESSCYDTEAAVPPAVPVSPAMAGFLEDVAKVLSEAHVLGTIPDVTTSSSLSELYSRVTKLVSGFGLGVSCYIATLAKPFGDRFTVVSQNGIGINDASQPETFGPHRNVLSKTLSKTDKAAEGAASFALRPDATLAVPDVSKDATVVPYGDGDKREDYLHLVPITVQLPNDTPAVAGVIGVEGSASRPLTDGHLAQIKALAVQLSDTREPLARARLARLYAHQCVQWCASLSGCRHVYVSLRNDVLSPQGGSDPSHYDYVAATAPQRFLVGQKLALEKGVTQATIAEGAAKHIGDVTTEAAVHYWEEANKEGGGQLLVAPVGNLGAVYLDTVGWSEGKKNLTKADVDMAQAAARHLASILDELKQGADSVGSGEEEEGLLKIEKEVSPGCVRFLKKIYLETATALKNMTKQDLLEMAKYNKPPEAVPPVCAATFIVLGKKPKVVSTWEQTRKLIKAPLLEKMAAFDPTGSKPAQAFFIRAKKMTKGFTVDVVAKKGSVPTSIFFNWTNITIQLRYAAASFRKLQAAGTLEVGDESFLGSEAATEDFTSSMGLASSAAGEEDDEATMDEGDADGDEGDAEGSADEGAEGEEG